MAQALPLYREAVRLKPDYWTAYNNIMIALGGLGDEEGVVRAGEQMMKLAGGRPGRAPENFYQNYDQEVWDLSAEHGEAIADMESHRGIGTTFYLELLYICGCNRSLFKQFGAGCLCYICRYCLYFRRWLRQ